MTAGYPDNITLTKESIQVTIGTFGVKENWTKLLTLITYPVATSKQDINTGSNASKIVDLLMKAEKRLTVRGKVSTANGSGDTNSAAYDKKEDLKKIFFAGGVVTMVWAGVTYTVNIEKCEADWNSNDNSPISSYNVMFTAVEGVDL